MNRRRGGILEDIEYLGRDLRLVAGGRIPRRRIFRTRLLYHPPIIIEDRECPCAWRTVLVCLYGGVVRHWGDNVSPHPHHHQNQRHQARRQMKCARGGGGGTVMAKTMHGGGLAYSSFMIMARSAALRPISTHFCLWAAASPGEEEWKMCWPAQSLSENGGGSVGGKGGCVG